MRLRLPLELYSVSADRLRGDPSELQQELNGVGIVTPDEIASILCVYDLRFWVLVKNGSLLSLADIKQCNPLSLLIVFRCAGAEGRFLCVWYTRRVAIPFTENAREPHKNALLRDLLL